MSPSRNPEDPHEGQPVLAAGAALENARAAMIMVHGRGASAEDILSLSEEFPDPDVAFIAPQAGGQVWYPLSFLSPIAANEPGISSGMAVLERIQDQVRKAGIPDERIMLLGFSQGACLVLEYAARHARRFGGVAGLSRRAHRPRGDAPGVRGIPRGNSGVPRVQRHDPHIPAPRVRLTEQVLGALGAVVTMRLYPEPGHSVNEDEAEAVRAMVSAVTAR